MLTAAAVAAVTIVLYSVIVLVPAPRVLVSLVSLAMTPALSLTSHEEAQAAGILSGDLLHQGELARARVHGAGALSHVQTVLSRGGQSLGQAEGEVWVLDMENLLGLLRDSGVE